jgi:anti-sigma factor RsiW
VVPLGTGTPSHDETQRLLPWLVTGRLDDDERARVQAHLAVCPRCRGELEWEQQLQLRYAGLQAEADAERGLAALRGRLGTQPPRPRAAALLAQTWQRLQAAWRATGPGVRGVLALQAAALLALAIGLASVLPAQDGGAYRTLGAAPAAAQANAVVRFRPEATELAIRRALQVSGARVVDGPTASGAYLLQLPMPHREDALKQLREDGAVLLAESLQ